MFIENSITSCAGTYLLVIGLLAGCTKPMSFKTPVPLMDTIAPTPQPVEPILTDTTGPLYIKAFTPLSVRAGEQFDVLVFIINNSHKLQGFDGGAATFDFEFFLHHRGNPGWISTDGKTRAKPFDPFEETCISCNQIVFLEPKEGYSSTSHLRLGNIPAGEYDLAIVRRDTSCGVVKTFHPITVRQRE